MILFVFGLSGFSGGIARAGFQKPSTSSAGKGTVSSTATRKASVKRKTRKTAYSARASAARRAKLARARAAARAEAARASAIPRLKMSPEGEVVPDVRAAAAIVYNPQTNEVLWEQHSQDQRSIASITKVMTAIVFLESNPDVSEQVLVERSDVRQASVTHLRANERVSVNDLLHLLLISSDNAAARVLARVSPQGADGFIGRMNEKAGELGLTSTTYADSSGLSADNVSSAYDMARLIACAAADERIAAIMQKAFYTVTTSRRRVAIHNTNALVRRTDLDVLGGKTGFIAQAGYCLATLLRLPEVDQQVVVVVLGARSNSGRFFEARNLFSWFSIKAQELLGRKQHEEQLAAGSGQ